MELGFAKSDITPRVGVELSGFGPFLNRHSVEVFDRLWARAMAVRAGGRRLVVIACDLIGVAGETTERVRALLGASHGLAPEEVMICCSHTHSGPSPGVYIGWGEADPPYLGTLPQRIARAAREALEALEPATLNHAEVPCEGIGINREYDAFWAPYEDAMAPGWVPSKPERTDTRCHVLAGRARDGRLLGAAAYFGCHPVVCCSGTRMIHGDYPGVALNEVERQPGGTVGLFLQGAQGDVNSAVGCNDEGRGRVALKVLAGRFADAVRRGIAQAEPVSVRRIGAVRREVVFSRLPWTRGEIERRLAECESLIGTDGEGAPRSDEDREVRLQTVYAIALRRMLARLDRGGTLSPAMDLQGVRLGPVALLGSPFETFQAIKNEVVASASAPIPLVVSFVNEVGGYATDETCAQRGGYAAEMVPMICGQVPFTNIHGELVRALLALDADLARSAPANEND
jgi:hypothetical protein